MNRIFPFLLFVCLFYSLQVSSQNTTDTIKRLELNQVSVIGSTADKTTPVSFKNIHSKEIELNNYGQEPSFILSQTPSITMHSDAGSYWGYSYIRLRGIDQTRINMTLNGVPLNEPEDQGVYFSNYPDFFQTLRNVQVQRGTGMSKNGTSSFAGSLIFESELPDTAAIGSLSVGLGSFGSYRATAGFNTGDLNGLSTSITASDIMSEGYKYHSGNKSSSFFLNSRYLKNAHTLRFIGFAGNQKNQLAWLGAPMDSILKEPRYNKDSDERDNFTQMHLQLHYQYGLKNSKLNTCVYYNYLKGNYDFDLNNFLDLPRTDEMYNYALKADFVGWFANYFLSYQHLTVNTGIHINHYKRNHVGSEKTTGWLYSNTGLKNEYSSFVRITYKLKQLTIYTDAQYRHAGFSYQGDQVLPKFKWDFFNYTAGLNYHVSDNVNIFYSIGKTNREPARNDIFLGNDNLYADSLGNSVYSDVKPETVLDQEAGIRLSGKRVSLDINLYYLSFKDEIVLNGKIGPTGLPLHSNSAKSYRSGVEVDFMYNVSDKLKLTTNASISSNKIKESGTSLQPILSPNFILNQSISWQMKNFLVSATGHYQGKSYIDYGNLHSIPEFLIISTNFSYRIKRVELFLFINNVTNKQYYSNGNLDVYNKPVYFVQAPINYFTGLKCTF